MHEVGIAIRAKVFLTALFSENAIKEPEQCLSAWTKASCASRTIYLTVIWRLWYIDYLYTRVQGLLHSWLSNSHSVLTLNLFRTQCCYLSKAPTVNHITLASSVRSYYKDGDFELYDRSVLIVGSRSISLLLRPHVFVVPRFSIVYDAIAQCDPAIGPMLAHLPPLTFPLWMLTLLFPASDPHHLPHL